MTNNSKIAGIAMMLLLSGGAAQARGCLAGAAAGGVAGHFAHHPILGAAAGCAIGHHMAHRHDLARGTTYHHHMFGHAT